MIFQVETPFFCRYACYKCNGDISPEIFRVDIKETTASLSNRLLKKGFFSKDEGNWHIEADDIHRNWKTYAYYIENVC